MRRKMPTCIDRCGKDNGDKEKQLSRPTHVAHSKNILDPIVRIVYFRKLVETPTNNLAM